MTKWQDESWRKGVKFGFCLRMWADRAVDILAGIAIGAMFVLWLVYA